MGFIANGMQHTLSCSAISASACACVLADSMCITLVGLGCVKFVNPGSVALAYTVPYHATVGYSVGFCACMLSCPRMHLHAVPPLPCPQVRAALSLWDGSGSFLFTSSMGVCAVDDGGRVDETNCPVVALGAGASTDRLLGAEEAVLQVGEPGADMHAYI